MKNIYKEIPNTKLVQINTDISLKFSKDNTYLDSTQFYEDTVFWSLGSIAQEKYCNDLIERYKESILSKMIIKQFT